MMLQILTIPRLQVCPQIMYHTPDRRESEHFNFFLPRESFTVLIFHCEFPRCWAYYHSYVFGHLLLHFRSVPFSSLSNLYMLNFGYFPTKLSLHFRNLNCKLLIIFWMINSLVVNAPHFIIQRILFGWENGLFTVLFSHRVWNEVSSFSGRSFVDAWKESGLLPFGGAEVWWFCMFVAHFIIQSKLRTNLHKINNTRIFHYYLGTELDLLDLFQMLKCNVFVFLIKVSSIWFWKKSLCWHQQIFYWNS